MTMQHVLRSCPLGLPDELIGTILRMLEFEDMLRMSQTCSRLRSVAMAHSALWQELPSVLDVSKLSALEPFLGRSRASGFYLRVRYIVLGDLPVLSPWIYQNLYRIRKMRLEFDDLQEGEGPDADALGMIHDALSQPAPLLEYLSLDGNWCEPFLGGLRPDILGGVAPNLRRLSLTAFFLDGPCPAFQGVTIVDTSVGAISPHPDAEKNKHIHTLFPAIQRLELDGIHGEGNGSWGDDELYRLARVPALNAPLSFLRLTWAEQDDWPDARAAAWIANSAQHVKRLHLESVRCALVSDAVLASNREKAHVLRIVPRNAEDVWLTHHSTDSGILRDAIVTPGQARAQVESFLLGAQYMRLEILMISTNTRCIHLLTQAWDALPRLHMLGLLVDWTSVDDNGWFVSPETLASIRPMNNVQTLQVVVTMDDVKAPRLGRMIDLHCVQAFAAAVAPKAAKGVMQVANTVVQFHSPA
ncbi:hypothetical protein AURDEDRAFT_129721 [Auricularia subglabra TFB-10046 SS5]|uniref:F-box domain-containing protein n=1 Tax=Auricularia subglabra (strain TFB-10046 / SS5) TaxID=717982 RepID=J0WV97_AURST|nr:hypothetical protein AURDEDRAFT_129721 [Auricularia subglabra TFB-10046 SS5]